MKKQENYENKADATRVPSLPYFSEIVRMLFSMAISVLIYYIAAWFIARTYHPDVATAVEETRKFIPFWMHGDIRPEPLESLLYRLALVFFPLGMTVFYYLSGRPRWQKFFTEGKWLNGIFYGILTGWLILFIVSLAASNPFYGSQLTAADGQRSCFGAYFYTLLLQTRPILYLFFYPLILLFFVGLARRSTRLTKVLNFLFCSVGYVLSVLLLLFIVTLNTTSFPEAWQGQYDLNSVYYSQTQVYAGTPVLTDNLATTYGLYAQFLNPIFQLTGLDVYRFTLVMSLLIVLGYVFLYVVLRRFVRSKALLVLGLVSLIFLPYLSGHCQTLSGYDSYFAAFPIRTFFPSLALALGAVYLSGGRFGKLVGNLSFFILPFGILWCPDLGLVTCFAWLLFLLYHDFFDTSGRFAWKKELRNIAFFFLGLLVAFGLYAGIVRLCYGVFPDYALLFRTIRVFSVGFYTLPMQVLHPWILVAAILLAGMVYSTGSLVDRKISPLSSMVLLAVLLGCGSFAYFQGRSHNGTLWIPALFAIFVAVLLTDRCWEQIRVKGNKKLWIPFAFCLFALFLSVPEALAKLPVLYRMSQPYHGQGLPADKARIAENKRFIDQNRKPGEKLVVLTSNKFQSFYFDGRKLKSGMNPGFLEVQTVDAWKHLMTVARDSAFPVFLDDRYFYYGHWNDLRAGIAARYYVEDNNRNSMSVLRLREYRLPEASFLACFSEVFQDTLIGTGVLYRKYTDDTAGYAGRIADAARTGFFEKGDCFSVEILFYNSLQHYQSVLVSNLSEASGIGLYAVPLADKSTIHHLAIGKTAFRFQLPQDSWCYLALQFDKSRLRIFNNGRWLGDVETGDYYAPSEKDFTIGNQGSVQNYIGAISEVCIRSGLHEADFPNRWNAIVASGLAGELSGL